MSEELWESVQVSEALSVRRGMESLGVFLADPRLG